MIDPTLLRASALNGDLWYPYALKMPIPEANTQLIITSRMLILHSMAGPNLTTLEGIHRYYYRDDIHTESTAASDMEGRMAQFTPINVRADCNAKANGFASSIESQDNGWPTLPWTSWSAPQFEQHAGFFAWMVMNPRTTVTGNLVPRWDGSGLGYHRQFPEWSIYVGKTCPGDARVAQVPFVLERAKVLINMAHDGEQNPPLPPNPFTPFEITDTLEDEMKLDYKGMVLEYDGFKLKRVISGKVAGISAIKSIDRQTLIDVMKESRTIRHPNTPYPFLNVPGYEDPELHFWWQAAEQNPA